MFWKGISYTFFFGVIGASVWTMSSLYSVKTPDAELVGIHQRESDVVREDGKKVVEYIEVDRKKPPYQFFGGKEDGIPLGGGPDTTKAVFLPRGVYRVSGYVYGDCVDYMDKSFTVSATSLGDDANDYPYFIQEQELLPSNRSSVEYDGILRIHASSKHIFEVNTESPFWGLRIERLTNSTKEGAWSGIRPTIKQNHPDKKHCWTDIDHQRERDRQQEQLDREFKRHQDKLWGS